MVMLLGSCATQKEVTPPPAPSSITNDDYTGPRKPVETVTGTLIFHPDSICYTGKDNRKYWFFVDPNASCLFITENQALYPLFSEHLPVALKKDVPSVTLIGVTINPVTIFRQDQLQQIANSQNWTLEQLNHFRVAKIFSYGTTNNLPATITVLRSMLSGANPQTPPPGDQPANAPAKQQPKNQGSKTTEYDPSKDF